MLAFGSHPSLLDRGVTSVSIPGPFLSHEIEGSNPFGATNNEAENYLCGGFPLLSFITSAGCSTCEVEHGLPMCLYFTQRQSRERALPPRLTFWNIFSPFGEFSLNHVIEAGFDHKMRPIGGRWTSICILQLLPVIQNHTRPATVELSLLCCYNCHIGWRTSGRDWCPAFLLS